ncbi:MAG: response regulator [Polyangiales bacterium]
MSAARILVVEDEAIIAYDLERTLQRLGYVVPGVVAEGEAAIEAAARLTPSLVLMDIKLRGALDGVDAARAIRDRMEMPVVFLTSHSDLATLSRAAAAQPQGYVMKPFVERDLHVAIEVAIRKHEVERALRRREQWFSTILRCVGDGVIATDERLAVSFVNHAAEALTGWRNDEAIGRPLDEVMRLYNRQGEPLDSPAAKALTSRATVSLDDAVTMVARDGARRVIDDSAAPIIDRHDRLLGAVVVFRDVTERKGLETQLARAERLVALGTLAAGICHEINNPLTHVIESLEWGLRTAGDEGPTAAVSGALAEARESAVRIGKIVQGVRAFAQPGAEVPRRVSLHEVLGAAVRLTTSEPRARARLTLTEHPAPDVFVDPERLTQVFVNLLLNASQAPTPVAGRAIEIAVVIDEAPQGARGRSCATTGSASTPRCSRASSTLLHDQDARRRDGARAVHLQLHRARLRRCDHRRERPGEGGRRSPCCSRRRPSPSRPRSRRRRARPRRWRFEGGCSSSTTRRSSRAPSRGRWRSSTTWSASTTPARPWRGCARGPCPTRCSATS